MVANEGDIALHTICEALEKVRAGEQVARTSLVLLTLSAEISREEQSLVLEKDDLEQVEQNDLLSCIAVVDSRAKGLDQLAHDQVHDLGAQVRVLAN